MRLDRAIEQVRGALEELRDLSRGIHPAILTEDGLGSALHEVTGRSPIPVQLRWASTNGCPIRSRSAPTTSSPKH